MENIAEEAELTTGAIFSLFGSKNELLAALAEDYLGLQYVAIEQAVPSTLDLAVPLTRSPGTTGADAMSRTRSRSLSLQVTLLDTAVRDPVLGAQLAVSIRTHEGRLVALFGGRLQHGDPVLPHDARRLAVALRGLFVGLSQGVLAGLIPEADEEFFADAARALASTAAILG